MSVHSVDLEAIDDVLGVIDELGFDVESVEAVHPDGNAVTFDVRVRAPSRTKKFKERSAGGQDVQEDTDEATEEPHTEAAQEDESDPEPCVRYVGDEGESEDVDEDTEDLPTPTEEGDPFHGEQDRSLEARDEDVQEDAGDEDVVFIKASGEASVYHRDADCQRLQSRNETAEKPLSVLPNRSPCSFCCPEAEDGSETEPRDVGEPTAPTADQLGISGVQGETYDAIREAGEIGAADLADELDVSKGTIYGRVHDLKDLGVLDTRQDGRSKLYVVSDGLDGLVDDGPEAQVADGGAAAVPAGASTAPDSWPKCGACGRPVSPDWARVNAEDPENPKYCSHNECPAVKARGEVREKRSGHISTVEGHDV